MSKLEELIGELCPNGVEYKKLGEVTSSINIGINPRKFFKLNPPNASCFYVTVRELNGLKGVKRYTQTDLIDSNTVNLINSRANIEVGDILFSNTGTVGKLALVVKKPIDWAVNEGIYVIKPLQDKINSRFLYYCLSSDKVIKQYQAMYTGSTLKHVTQKCMEKIKIPLPPMEIQCEIVRILDNFTELTAELTEELTDRKQQYEYYKNVLLTFSSMVKSYTLEEICEYSIDRIDASQVNEETYVGVDNLLQNKEGKTISTHVPVEGRLIKFSVGDILIGNIRPYLKKIWLADECGGTNGDVLVIHIKNQSQVIPRYLYYILSSDDFFRYDEQNSKGAKMPRGDKKAIMNYLLPIPSIAEQFRVINILDHFEIYCNDLTVGLPAEIETRQKQYEYYRDKLLSFKEYTG